MRLIELLDVFLLVNRVFKGLNRVELADCLLVEGIYTSKGSLTNSFLVVCQEETSELMSLEEVTSMVLWLRQRKDLNTLRCWDICRAGKMRDELLRLQTLVKLVCVLLS